MAGQSSSPTPRHAASRASSACLAATPPRYWPIDPSLRTTRWHGTTTGTGFVAHAVPAAAHGAGRSDRGGDGGVALGGAERDHAQVLEHLTPEPRGEAQVDRDVERAPAAGEVLVELARDAVEARRRQEDPRAHRGRQGVEHGVVALAREGDAHEPLRRGGQQERAERAVDGAVGDVEQPLAVGPCRRARRGPGRASPRPAPGMPSNRLAHDEPPAAAVPASVARSRATPSAAARRAAASDPPSSAATSA